MKVYVAVFRLRGKKIACEVAADTETETIQTVRQDKESTGATDIKVLGELKEPAMLRWLPYIPSHSWIEHRHE